MKLIKWEDIKFGEHYYTIVDKVYKLYGSDTYNILKFRSIFDLNFKYVQFKDYKLFKKVYGQYYRNNDNFSTKHYILSEALDVKETEDYKVYDEKDLIINHKKEIITIKYKMMGNDFNNYVSKLPYNKFIKVYKGEEYNKGNTENITIKFNEHDVKPYVITLLVNGNWMPIGYISYDSLHSTYILYRLKTNNGTYELYSRSVYLEDLLQGAFETLIYGFNPIIVDYAHRIKVLENDYKKQIESGSELIGVYIDNQQVIYNYLCDEFGLHYNVINNFNDNPNKLTGGDILYHK